MKSPEILFLGKIFLINLLLYFLSFSSKISISSVVTSIILLELLIFFRTNLYLLGSKLVISSSSNLSGIIESLCNIISLCNEHVFSIIFIFFSSKSYGLKSNATLGISDKIIRLIEFNIETSVFLTLKVILLSFFLKFLNPILILINFKI